MGLQSSPASRVHGYKGRIASVLAEAGAEPFRHKFNATAVSVPGDIYPRLSRPQATKMLALPWHPPLRFGQLALRTEGEKFTCTQTHFSS